MKSSGKGPIHIRGESPDGGHSWVISGYDNGTPGETYFWMNLGWGAADIGWYRFDTIPSGIWFNHAADLRNSPGQRGPVHGLSLR